MILRNKTINFLGDSITEGVGTTDESRIYLNVLKEEYGLKKVNNYGISGTRFAQQRKPTVNNPSFDQNFASRIEIMDENADMVIVFGGTNDYGHGDAPMGKCSDRTPDTFYGACHDLFARLVLKFPGKPVIIMTPMHRVEEEPKGIAVGKERDFSLTDYVDVIKETARFYSLPVCDLFANSGIQPKLAPIQEMFMPDGVHPNDAGHQIIARRLGGFLTSL